LPGSVGVNDTSNMALLTCWTSFGRLRPDVGGLMLISMLPSPASATFTAFATACKRQPSQTDPRDGLLLLHRTVLFRSVL